MKPIHGMSRLADGKPHKVYRAWSAMLSRCRNPRDKKYRNYGGRGISVCERWKDFSAFLEDMGLPPSDDHSLDRIDNGGPYEKVNCRWATWLEQNNNTRRNRRHCGETQAQLARRLRMTRQAIYSRMKKYGENAECIAEPKFAHCIDGVSTNEWARRIGVHRSTLNSRIKAGWPKENVLSGIKPRR